MSLFNEKSSGETICIGSSLNTMYNTLVTGEIDALMSVFCHGSVGGLVVV